MSCCDPERLPPLSREPLVLQHPAARPFLFELLREGEAHPKMLLDYGLDAETADALVRDLERHGYIARYVYEPIPTVRMGRVSATDVDRRHLDYWWRTTPEAFHGFT